MPLIESISLLPAKFKAASFAISVLSEQFVIKDCCYVTDNIKEDKAVIATYKKIPFKLTVNSVDNATINPTGVIEVYYGDTKDVSIVAKTAVNNIAAINSSTGKISIDAGTEAKNGAGATPIKTEKGWIHISHGVRNTADGLRYVLYVYVTDLSDPSKVIAEPGGVFLVPLGSERTGDVSNVVFSNGAIEKDGKIFIYYASSDTRMHVATTTVEKLLDYAFNTPKDPLRSPDCVKQRCELIKKNLELL